MGPGCIVGPTEYSGPSDLANKLRRNASQLAKSVLWDTTSRRGKEMHRGPAAPLMEGLMEEAQRQAHIRRFVLKCVLDCRPFHCRRGDGERIYMERSNADDDQIQKGAS